MPFTLSHPAAVARLSRYGLILSALVIGSMSPDVPFFLPEPMIGHYGHTLLGVFLLAPLITLLFLAVFHGFLKRPLSLLLPDLHQRRLQPFLQSFAFAPPRRFFLIICSAWIGALSHVAWDSFTHRRGWFVRRVPAFQAPLMIDSHYQIQAYRVVQHVSSVLGLALLAYWYWRWLKNAPEHPLVQEIAFPGWSRAVAAMVLTASLTAPFVWNLYVLTPRTLLGWQRYVGLSVVQAIQVALGMMIVFSAACYWAFYKRKKRLKTGEIVL
jgi:hypothetical protein